MNADGVLVEPLAICEGVVARSAGQERPSPGGPVGHQAFGGAGISEDGLVALVNQSRPGMGRCGVVGGKDAVPRRREIAWVEHTQTAPGRARLQVAAVVNHVFPQALEHGVGAGGVVGTLRACVLGPFAFFHQGVGEDQAKGDVLVGIGGGAVLVGGTIAAAGRAVLAAPPVVAGFSGGNRDHILLGGIPDGVEARLVVH